MDRRKYLKSLVVGGAGASLLLQSCEPGAKEEIKEVTKTFTIDRTPDELKRELKLASEKFFDEHEMKTISILSDIIIPKDETSGSATDAGVPAFIEFISKDMPRYQTPLRGGLKWLDIQCMKRFNADFASCTAQQQIEMIDEIAFPEKAKPEMQQGVAFFNTMRDLTACGFFTSQIGIKDLGYVGNKANDWDGVPQDVLDQYGMKYDERTLAESVKFGA
ncbi:MAG TPA: gluconate 2-dehydrogenase subunit 3 family protein [Chryseolinea sp.]|nr:gluconate 2-dehydrogenase subunit 3 family protein [Chryseolinea sp.]HPH46487.1 gluconate 2-dehydrogenase subunit 3 family protein [Chryseolinea sp.]HPM31553.1 gluconate 2-dehydrogenase subunit 3 family protein [Chryseolinea sp.]